MNRVHLVRAVLRGKKREPATLYEGEDHVKAAKIYDAASIDPKNEEVGLALNIQFIRTCCPRAQAVNAATNAQTAATVSELKAPQPETTLKPK